MLPHAVQLMLMISGYHVESKDKLGSWERMMPCDGMALLTFNQRVPGSSPGAPTRISIG